MTFAAGIGLGILIAALPFMTPGAAIILWVGSSDDESAEWTESTC